VSGRGVGLDAVKSGVEAVGGVVVATSESGRGVRFTLTLPLTLTTIRALLVAAGGQTFALDTAWVAKLLRAGADDLRTIEGRDVLLLDGAPVPIVALTAVLGLRDTDEAVRKAKRPVALLKTGHGQAAFVVDELLDEQEVTVRTLGPRLQRVKHVSGGTILPTGSIALILNASELVQSVHGWAGSRLAAVLPAAKTRTARRILLVDDSVTTRALERNILEIAGFEVISAADGAEAWQLLQEKGADLVVSDVDMPRLDGFALTETIRASRHHKEVPVVLVTARESEEDRIRGMQAGANAYLPKNAFDQQALLEAIRQLL
jgi:two-component system chemotaxis sensor kinase CheA